MANTKNAMKDLQKLQDQAMEMKSFIENFQVEYDSKVSSIKVLEEQIESLQKNAEEIKSVYRKEITAAIEQDLSDQIAEADLMFNAAKTQKEEAERAQKEATERTNAVIDYEKTKRDEIAIFSKTQKQEADSYQKTTKLDADTYSKQTRQEADSYSKSSKQETDKYVTEKKHEMKVVETTLKQKKQELDKFESELHEKEQALVSLENELKKKEEAARFGFHIELKEERKKFDDEVENVKLSIAGLEKMYIDKRDEISTKLQTYKEQELKKIADSIQAQKNEIAQENAKLADIRKAIEKRDAESKIKLDELNIKAQAYQEKFSEIEDIAQKKLESMHMDLIAEKENYRNKLNEIGEKYDIEHKKVLELTTKLKAGNGMEVDSLLNEIKTLKNQIDSIQDNENSVIKKLREYNVDSAQIVSALYKIQEYDPLLEKYESLNKSYETIRLANTEIHRNEESLAMETKRANQYQQNYEFAILELEKSKKPTKKERLSRFDKFDEFDHLSKLTPFDNSTLEKDWLKYINQKMKDSGILIPERLLYAFHTSVKIHEWSPIVVLAGVSGTGKSELPRQYARHGGMNYVSVPVKPDWDSMQSLFGYYNSIENKFEPTEISRAIYYMQSEQMKNNVLLVLLDEMNLAYVELYFSDLLSKFESNRGTNDKITYEISLGAADSEQLVIGNNILWAGTMNEDETTKALSDKVIDRSTLLTFPRPSRLVSRNSNVKIALAEKRLPYNLWTKWCGNTLTEESVNKEIDINLYRKIVEDINDQMSKVNRNLGHRVWQSIERYVFSHPQVVSNFGNGNEFKKQLNAAFAEAIAFKIMPKLRGIEVSGESKKVLDSIGSIITQEIPTLEADYKHAMGLSSRIFQWCSAKFIETE